MIIVNILPCSVSKYCAEYTSAEFVGNKTDSESAKNRYPLPVPAQNK